MSAVVRRPSEPNEEDRQAVLDALYREHMRAEHEERAEHRVIRFLQLCVGGALIWAICMVIQILDLL